MKRYRRVLTLALALVMMFSLQLAVAPTAAAEEEIVVNVLHYFIPDSGETMNDVYLEIEAEFLENYKKEHPNVTFNIERIQQAQAEPKIQTMAASGTLPDVFPLKGCYVNNYYKNGLLYDMTEFATASEGWDTVKGSLVDAFTRDGKILGVPYQFAPCSMVFYNEAMWKEIGYDTFPNSWDEVLKAADLFAEKGITCISQGNAKQWNFECCWLCTFGDRYTGTEWTQSIIAADGKAKFTDPEFVQCLEDFQKLIYGTNLCNPDYNAITNDIADTMYLEGNAAATVNGYWFVGKVQNLATEEVFQNTKIANLPDIPGTKGEPGTSTGGAGYSLGMNANLTGEAAQAAADYILACAGKPYSDKFFADYGTPGAFNYEGELDESKFDHVALDYLNFCNTTKFTPIYDTSMDGSIMSVMLPDLQELLNGTMTAQEVAEDCQKALEIYMASNQ